MVWVDILESVVT